MQTSTMKLLSIEVTCILAYDWTTATAGVCFKFIFGYRKQPHDGFHGVVIIRNRRRFDGKGLIMTAVLSPSSSSPSTSPQPIPMTSPSSQNLAALPPLVTSTPRRSNLQRPPSYAQNRFSTYSNNSSGWPQDRSRPPSHVFPIFHTSLPYTLVRDFAYPIIHPMHYGPPPESSAVPSGASTPASEYQRRLSDPAKAWGSAAGGWSAGPWGGIVFTGKEQGDHRRERDGPPYSEDEDIKSPVVKNSKHKKPKSSAATNFTRGKMGEISADEDNRAHYAGTAKDGSKTYYVTENNEPANGPGGEYVTYPPNHSRRSMAGSNSDGRRDSHFAALLPNRSYVNESRQNSAYDSDDSDTPSSPRYDPNDSRYSRDYQFTIASPDEEMHGKAVALFDFARENENELPLVEGQVIWVSYRHGQGWLVAEDPKTRESGLVPEEYVRLLRDIQGGWRSLTGDLMTPVSASEIETPTQTEHSSGLSSAGAAIAATESHGNGQQPLQQQHPPTVSSFSTSSKDLEPYPPHLLGTQLGQTPPQVVHYHSQKGGSSQANTPTLTNPGDAVGFPGQQRPRSTDSRRSLQKSKAKAKVKAGEEEEQEQGGAHDTAAASPAAR